MGAWIHRMVWIDPATRTGLCINCGVVPINKRNNNNGGTYRCAIEDRERQRTKPNNSLSPQQRRITKQQLQRFLVVQKNSCAICRCRFENKNYCIDHDHNTNKIRGLLCRKCNVGIGLLGDSIDNLARASEYLVSAML